MKDEIKINDLVRDVKDCVDITFWYDRGNVFIGEDVTRTYLDRTVKIPKEAMKDLYKQLKGLYGDD